MMTIKNVVRVSTLFAALSLSAQLRAMPEAVPETWGGDLVSRPRLTGNWGGLRDEMAKKGVTFDVDVYSMPQIISGGKNNEGGFWGNAIATLNVDTDKAGLWPGGFLKVQTVTGFGENLAGDIGAIVPANINWMLPSFESDTGLQEFIYTQFLSEKFGVFLGKINTIAPTNNFHGDYHNGFMNTALDLPMALALVPLSAYGAGALCLPTPDITLVGMALDPNGTIKDDDLGEIFNNGVMAIGSADLKINPWDLSGHQNVMFAWSNKDRPSLTQAPSNIASYLLTARFPRLGNPGPLLSEILATRPLPISIPPQPLKQESETWAAVYSFEHFLWQPDKDPKRGVGAFFSVGVSDGNPNPIKYSYSLGLVGKGIVPGRLRDDFGIGWARTEFSDDFVPSLRNRFDLGLDHEDAIELYYNASITPWLNIVPSFQAISPALNKTVDSSGNLKDIDTIYIASVNVGIRF